MRTLYKEGKIPAIGVSNFSIDQMERFRRFAPIHELFDWSLDVSVKAKIEARSSSRRRRGPERIAPRLPRLRDRSATALVIVVSMISALTGEEG